MIKEAYVSFEVAKLLKEKGFESFTTMVYRNPNRLFIHNEKEELIPNHYHKKKGDVNEILAPTHQMAMAWLREVKGLFIAINCDDLNYNWQVFDVQHRDKNGDPICQSESFGGYYNYEKATDDAIKYCLEKIIL